jgi:hypothetical protein
VKLSCQRHELRPLGDGSLEGEQRRGCTGFGIEQGAGNQVGEDTYGMDLACAQRVPLQQVEDLLAGVTAGLSASTVSGTRRSPAGGRDVVEQLNGLVEVPGQCPGDHAGEPAGDHDAERATGAQGLMDRGQGLVRLVDHFEHTVAEHQIGPTRFDVVQQISSITLHTVNTLRDAVVVGSALQRCQGIRAGVDDGDTVTESSHSYGQPPGATAEVDDSQLALLGE